MQIKFDQRVATDAQDLITKIMKLDPQERLTIQQIFSHPFVVRCYGPVHNQGVKTQKPPAAPAMPPAANPEKKRLESGQRVELSEVVRLQNEASCFSYNMKKYQAKESPQSVSMPGKFEINQKLVENLRSKEGMQNKVKVISIGNSAHEQGYSSSLAKHQSPYRLQGGFSSNSATNLMQVQTQASHLANNTRVPKENNHLSSANLQAEEASRNQLIKLDVFASSKAPAFSQASPEFPSGPLTALNQQLLNRSGSNVQSSHSILLGSPFLHKTHDQPVARSNNHHSPTPLVLSSTRSQQFLLNTSNSRNFFHPDPSPQRVDTYSHLFNRTQQEPPHSIQPHKAAMHVAQAPATSMSTTLLDQHKPGMVSTKSFNTTTHKNSTPTIKYVQIIKNHGAPYSASTGQGLQRIGSRNMLEENKIEISRPAPPPHQSISASNAYLSSTLASLQTGSFSKPQTSFAISPNIKYIDRPNS